jgi:alpha-methylacyl-CoA racemase
VTPVLTIGEAPLHPHNVARGTYEVRDGVTQPRAVPRFSRTVPAPAASPRAPGADSRAVLTELGLAHDEIDVLAADGVFAEVG